MKKGPFIAMVLIAIGVVILIFFSIKQRNSGNEIIVPAVVDLTGPIGLYGQWAVDGMKMAVEDINLQGGVREQKVKLIIEDAQSNPQAGVNAFQKILVTLTPGVIIVATNTSTVMACAPIANERKVVLFTPIASGPNVSQAGDFVFRNRVSGYYEATEMGFLSADYLKLKRIALVIINNDAGPGYVKAFKEAFETRGGYITNTAFIEPEETDYRTIVIQVRASKPEAVFLALTVKEAALFIRQSTEIGFRPKWLSMTTVMTDDLFKIAGDNAEGLILVAEGGEKSNPLYNQFEKKFKTEYGYRPTMNAINGYDAVRLLIDLIVRFGNNGKKIRDGLYATKDYNGVGGLLSFDKNGDANKPLSLFIVKGKEFVRFK